MLMNMMLNELIGHFMFSFLLLYYLGNIYKILEISALFEIKRNKNVQMILCLCVKIMSFIARHVQMSKIWFDGTISWRTEILIIT